MNDKKPNIIVVLSDDLGYADLGCYENRALPTPNLVRLSSEGTLYENIYVMRPVFSPSCCRFITRQYPSRWRVEGNIAASNCTGDKWNSM